MSVCVCKYLIHYRQHPIWCRILSINSRVDCNSWQDQQVLIICLMHNAHVLPFAPSPPPKKQTSLLYQSVFFRRCIVHFSTGALCIPFIGFVHFLACHLFCSYLDLSHQPDLIPCHMSLQGAIHCLITHDDLVIVAQVGGAKSHGPSSYLGNLKLKTWHDIQWMVPLWPLWLMLVVYCAGNPRLERDYSLGVYLE